jgi:hypothetical protein
MQKLSAGPVSAIYHCTAGLMHGPWATNLHRLGQPNAFPVACQRLCDHPVLVGFMHEFLAHPELSSQVAKDGPWSHSEESEHAAS